MLHLRIFIFLLAGVPGYLSAQEVVLRTLPKPVTGFSAMGARSAYSGAGLGSAGMDRIDVYEAKDGFITRDLYHLTKFDFNGTRIWEGEFSEYFGIEDREAMYVLSDEKATYILQLKRNSVKATKTRVVHISPEGVFTEYKIDSDMNTFAGTEYMSMGAFIANGELKVMAPSGNVVSGRIPYRLYTLDRKGNRFTSRDLNLPHDAFEVEQVRKVNDLEVYLKRQYVWYKLGKNGDNVMLCKHYVKEVKKSNRPELVLQLLEMDVNGNIINNKSIDFQPTYGGEDREFVKPSIHWNEFDHSLSVLGMMEIDNRKINGLYLLKYDFPTGSLVYSREYPFVKILMPQIKPPIKVLYELPERANNYYNMSLPYGDVFISPQNGFIDVRILTFLGRKETSYFVTKFDQYGDHVQTSVVKFDASMGSFAITTPQPELYEVLWKDKKRPQVVSSEPSAMDLANQTAWNKTKEESYTWPLEAVKKLVKYNQATGVFSLITNTNPENTEPKR